MHIAVGNASSTLRTRLITLIMLFAVPDISSASYNKIFIDYDERIDRDCQNRNQVYKLQKPTSKKHSKSRHNSTVQSKRECKVCPKSYK
jgi:hypothetical protein